MKYFVRLFILCFCCTVVLAQNKLGYIWPLDTPCVITGNYGELRPNHFHAGIDFSTNGSINKNVYAVEDGYISRIRVSSGGYGKCIYITHPGNKVTVYAHLNKFGLKAAELVKAEQLALKKFEVELLPAPGRIKVKKGEVVGLSGNSGGSTGPHLHFEIRDEKSETPLNPLEFYTIPDRLAPVAEAVAFYDLSDTLSPQIIRSARLSGASTPTFILQQSEIGLAFFGYDLNYSRGNKNNVYQAELQLDGKLIYSHRLRTIDFADGRFVNEFHDVHAGKKYQKCFIPTLYPPRFFDASKNKGHLSFKDTLYHQVRLTLRDESGNATVKDLVLKSFKKQTLATVALNDPLFVDCRKDFLYNGKELKLFIPAGTLYRSAQLKIDNKLAEARKLEILPLLNLRSVYVLGFILPQTLKNNNEKLVLTGGGGAVPGQVRNDSVYFYLKNTGSFSLQFDLAAPTIRTQIAQSRLKNMRNFSSFSFIIRDELSGINSYNVYVNNQWVIAEYDAKNHKLTYYFDEDTPKGPLDFRVDVTDRVGNKKEFSYKLQR